MSFFLIKLMLMEYDFIALCPSLVAASALCLTRHFAGQSAWTRNLESLTGYSAPSLRQGVEALAQTVRRGQEAQAAQARSDSLIEMRRDAPELAKAADATLEAVGVPRL